jgi:hypothetical protein
VGNKIIVPFHWVLLAQVAEVNDRDDSFLHKYFPTEENSRTVDCRRRYDQPSLLSASYKLEKREPGTASYELVTKQAGAHEGKTDIDESAHLCCGCDISNLKVDVRVFFSSM